MNLSLRVRTHANVVPTDVQTLHQTNPAAPMPDATPTITMGTTQGDAPTRSPLSRLSSGSCVLVSASDDSMGHMGPRATLGPVSRLQTETAGDALHLAAGCPQGSLSGRDYGRGLHEPLYRTPIFHLFTDAPNRRDHACRVLQHWTPSEIQEVEHQIVRVQNVNCTDADGEEKASAYLSGALTGAVAAAMALLGHKAGLAACDAAIGLIEDTMKSHERSAMVMIAIGLAVSPKKPPVIRGETLKALVQEKMRRHQHTKNKKFRRAQSGQIAEVIARALTCGQSNRLAPTWVCLPPSVAKPCPSEGGQSLSGSFEHVSLDESEQARGPEAEKQSFVTSWLSRLYVSP